MGAACCVAAKDKNIVSAPPSETFQRHTTRYSPSWSFRWDNRGRVAGEETSTNWLGDGGGGNDQREVKSGAINETGFISEEGSPLDSSRSLAWLKSPVSEGDSGILRLPSSGQANSQHTIEAKQSTESPSVSPPSPIKLSPSSRSVSSLSTSPLSSQTNLHPPNSAPAKLRHRSPGHLLLRQVSDSRIPQYKSPSFSISEEGSPFLPLTWANESNRGFNGGSSDSWSIPAFSDLTTDRRERWSFGSDASGFGREKITRSSGRNSGSHSFDLQTCGVCSKLITERASWRWSGQKTMISSNEIAVVSVLTCGHVFHAECLEYMTPEIIKYDPACPICTIGEKRAVKTSDKVLKIELDSKARKRLKKRVVDSDVVFDCQRSDEKGLTMSSSSSMKRSSGKQPFLWRHFSFGPRASRALSEDQGTRRSDFFWARFWARSSKE